MSCDTPLKGYRSLERHLETGKPLITFNPLKALNSTNPIMMPCGQCMGCRLERSRQWALRMSHEAQLYDHNSFITLTFDDEHLPSTNSINVRDWQLFMKRLRASIPHKIRFYACGEYGDLNLRPHYHAIIFNHQFTPKTLWSENRGNPLYTSPSLTKHWPYGLATLGNVTFESAAYVARYVTKKITGDRAAEHYTRRHPLTGELHQVEPEAAWMSRRPGLGATWLIKYHADVYPSDFIVHDGKKMRPPRAYDKSLTEEELAEFKRRRKASSLRFKPDQQPARLRARAAVREARMRTVKRKL